MAVRLRLVRMGKKKQPTYRVVAADKRSPRNGKFIEIIGTYEPRRDPSIVKIDSERALHWLRHGAQPSERVEKLLKLTGAWDEFKGNPPGTSGKLIEPAEAPTRTVEPTETKAAPEPAPEPEPEAPADTAAEADDEAETTEAGEPDAPAASDESENE